MSDRKSAFVPTVVAAVAGLVVLVMVAGPALTSGTDTDTGEDRADTAAETRGDPGADSGADPGADRAPDDTWEQLVRREPGDPMALGEVDAPVVMISYSEFQCPFCGKFARDTEPGLVEKYVADGTLRIEWKDFPYLGPESVTAAMAGRAAAAQGKFWKFHDAMYADQLPPNSGRLDEAYVASVAERVGLDLGRFRRDMSDAETRRAVEQDFAEGQAIGVTGTPTFVINGVPIIGAQPADAFEQAIEEAAAEARE